MARDRNATDGKRFWIPAFAGTTGGCPLRIFRWESHVGASSGLRRGRGFCGRPAVGGIGARCGERPVTTARVAPVSPVLPAKAGIHRWRGTGTQPMASASGFRPSPERRGLSATHFQVGKPCRSVPRPPPGQAFVGARRSAGLAPDAGRDPGQPTRVAPMSQSSPRRRKRRETQRR